MDLGAMFTQHNQLLENLSYAATMLGVPILIVSYITALVAEDRRREVGTYETLETQYVDFQKLALRYPLLDVADVCLTRNSPLDDGDRVVQRTLYMILFSLFERAYLMYQTGNTFGLRGMRKKQWASWVDYMTRYFARESCREAWFNGEPPRADVRQDFDDRFERFVFKLMQDKGWVKT